MKALSKSTSALPDTSTPLDILLRQGYSRSTSDIMVPPNGNDLLSRHLSSEVDLRVAQHNERDAALKSLLDEVARKQRMSDYRDYANVALSYSPVVPVNLQASPLEMRQQQASLPQKLHVILSNPNYEHIVSWLPHGRAWKIHNLSKFSTLILPLYFDMAGSTSSLNMFLRLLKIWGFSQFTEGPDITAYYHEVCTDMLLCYVVLYCIV
jgi:HSF-type DNA-binding